MVLLITGLGLVGSQAAALAVSQGEHPIVYELNPQIETLRGIVDPKEFELVRGDLLNREQFERDISPLGVDRIIHTVANPMLTIGAQSNPIDAIKLNIMGTANVLETARKLGISKVVLCSSSVLYNDRTGGLENGKFQEDNYPRPTTIYATTKLACENLGINYAESYGLKFVALRFRAVFGPWVGRGGGGGPTSIFRKLLEASFAGEEVTVPSKYLEFVYSKDAAKATIIAANSEASLETRIYNVSMGKTYSWNEIASLVAQRIPSAKIVVSEQKEKISKPEPIDLTRSRDELGFEPSYDMPHAIDDYISFYKIKS